MWFLRFAGTTGGRARRPGFGHGAVWWQAEDGSECAVYLERPKPIAVPPNRPPRLPDSAVRLEPLGPVHGDAAMASVAGWHYVVATDVLPAAEADFNAWYDQEHLPGLAAVPGVLRARRFQVVDGPGPRYHACYDLVDRSAFNSPAWLAVRGTPWSEQVRPCFRHTRRTMYRRD